jgi:Fe-S oxidoreductase
MPETHFDYSEHGGLGRAVEMCSGLGACRKTLDGTMCPSYMATREEADSTRGRANVLRLAMAGRLDESGLGDEGVSRVLDLCLECRACKAECPVGVDVARFKSEFLADYWRRHGVARSARAMAGVHELARWGSRLAPFSNWVVGSWPARYLGERMFGVDRRRRLPAFRRRTLAQIVTPAAAADVVLFADTFTNYCDPDIGAAAIDVLAAVGRGAGLVRHVCCGRPKISKGLLQQARVLGERNVEALYPHASAGRPIVFCEPSCLSAMREDVPSLLRGEAQRKAAVIASACVSFEEVVLGGSEPLRLANGPPAILLHGHCHQKSMGLLGATQALLARIPGSTIVDLDAGCCGMAGSFGYAREHFELSRQIGERRLFPAVRTMKPGTVIVATGTSCRRQVRDFTGREAVHPAVLVQSLLTSPQEKAAP